MLTPWWISDNGETTLTLYQGDVRVVLQQMPAESVQCVVTSPPYYGLRDYGTATWEGGDPDCDHIEKQSPRRDSPGGYHNSRNDRSGEKQPHTLATVLPYRDVCGKCGARRIDAQLGLEKTPDEYVAKMVEVFREVRRVLRRDGTCFLNMGDGYASTGDRANNNGQGTSGLKNDGRAEASRLRSNEKIKTAGMELPRVDHGLKPKDLLGMPWRVAFALQADGWWLRSDIIWSKPNPMPESVTDRPTKAHEYLFLLTKAATYFYDGDAIREPHVRLWDESNGGTYAHPVANELHGITGYAHTGPYPLPNPAGRNKRTVWTIATEAYADAHFATFPQKLVEPCLLAGTSEKGCCLECGAPWERVTDGGYNPFPGSSHDHMYDLEQGGTQTHLSGEPAGTIMSRRWRDRIPAQTVGWQPTCSHDRPPQPCTVLDPFSGSGTTLLVAQRLGRHGVGIELKEDYCRMSVRRLEAEHSQMKLPM